MIIPCRIGTVKCPLLATLTDDELLAKLLELNLTRRGG